MLRLQIMKIIFYSEIEIYWDFIWYFTLLLYCNYLFIYVLIYIHIHIQYILV